MQVLLALGVSRRIARGDRCATVIRSEATGAEYWISGCKRRGGDRLHGSAAPVEIDDDAQEEYWRDIRKAPELATRSV
jgi:hypothetical protein